MRFKSAFRFSATAITGQFSVQAVGFIAGLVVVRLLPVKEYAYYTILYSVLGMLSVLTDSGVANSTLAQAGRHWGDTEAVNSVLASAFYLRRRVALLTLSIALPVCGSLLFCNGMSHVGAILTTLALIPLFICQQQCQIAEIPIRLFTEVTYLQILQVKAAVLRLVTTTAALIASPLAAIAVLAAGGAQWWLQLKLGKALEARGCVPTQPDPKSISEFRRILARSAPQAAYYALSSQISQLLLTMFGKVNDIAGLGAISRYAALYAITSAALGYVATPWFSKSRATGGALMRQYIWVLMLFSATCMLIAIGIVLTSPLLIWLLGPSYTQLNAELGLLALYCAMNAVAGAAYSMSAARNVVPPSTLAIGGSVAVNALGIVILPINTVRGVIELGMLTSGFSLALYVICFLHYCRTPWQATS